MRHFSSVILLIYILSEIFICRDVILISVFVFHIKLLTLYIVRMHYLHDLFIVRQYRESRKVFTLTHKGIKCMSCGEECIITLSGDA